VAHLFRSPQKSWSDIPAGSNPPALRASLSGDICRSMGSDTHRSPCRASWLVPALLGVEIPLGIFASSRYNLAPYSEGEQGVAEQPPPRCARLVCQHSCVRFRSQHLLSLANLAVNLVTLIQSGAVKSLVFSSLIFSLAHFSRSRCLWKNRTRRNQRRYR